MSTRQQDVSQQALIKEFGQYLTVLTEGFAKPVQAAIQQSESDVRSRMRAHQESLEATHRASLQKTLDQCKSLDEKLQALTIFVQNTQRDLDVSRKAFVEETTRRLCGDVQAEMKSSRTAILSDLAAMQQLLTRQVQTEIDSVRTVATHSRTQLKFVLILSILSLLLSGSALVLALR
jgi:hypothetical protein